MVYPHSLSRIRLPLVGLLALLLTLLAGPLSGLLARSAQACPPPLPGTSPVYPEADGTLAVGADIVARRQGVENVVFSATVDGAPVELLDVSADYQQQFQYLGSMYHFLRPSPAPGPGQVVTIMSDCTDCEPWSVSVGERADERVPTIIDMNLDVQDTGRMSLPCGGDADLEYVLSFAVDTDVNNAQEFYQVEIFTDASMQEFVRAGLVRPFGGQAMAYFYFLRDTLEERHPPDAFCFRITGFDSAGQVASEPAILCTACRFKPLDSTDPEWSDDDLYSSEVCDVAPVLGQPLVGVPDSQIVDPDDDPEPAAGCSVGSDGNAPLWLVLGLVALACRRRSASAS